VASAGLPAATIAAWNATLDDGERARAARFVGAQDRIDFIAAHALARALLAAFGGRKAAEWRFAEGLHGKPRIDAALGCDDLRFNISHTRGLVACAVTRGHEIGVDVEAWDRLRSGRDIAARFFTPDEVALIRAAPLAEEAITFFRLWTLKEAVMKATGLGFRLALDAFAVTAEPPSVRFYRDISDDPALWHFAQRLIAPNFVIAAALRGPAAAEFDMRPAAIDTLG
jgi:4'-phosphopantetheinyl transferase